MSEENKTVETFIFLDIDGVLNVGVGDGTAAPVLLSQANCRLAERAADPVWAKALQANPERACIEKVVSVIARPCAPNSAETYADLACRGGNQLAAPLVQRFAILLKAVRAAGPVKVVLASNWRKPCYADRVVNLERELSTALGRPFTFDAATPSREELSAADRLSCIGDFLAERCAAGGEATHLRALVLEDFFVTPLDGWACGDHEIRSEGDAEAYLRSRLPNNVDLDARVLHSFEEWASDGGVKIQLGTGLSDAQVQEAVAFLAGSARQLVSPPPAEPMLLGRALARHDCDAAVGKLVAEAATGSLSDAAAWS